MARATSLGGYPIEQHDSPNKGGAMTGHKGIVLHIAQGYYRGTIAWQNNPDQRYSDGTQVTTCSTWIVGREPGEWAQMVDTGRIAWCQMGGSYDWLSIELAGFAPTAPSAWQIEACAQLLAWAHRTHGIPLLIANHPGVRGLGHHSMDREGIDPEWGHDSCPGAGVIDAKAAIVARAIQINGGDDDMSWDETIGNNFTPKPGYGQHQFRTAIGWMWPGIDAANAKLDAIAAKVDIDPTELAAIEAAAKRGAEAGMAASADEFVARILAGLPDGTLTPADVETAVRRVLGSLDGATPQQG